MERDAANRIIELAMKWTDSGAWYLTFVEADSNLDESLSACGNWDKYETMADALSESIPDGERVEPIEAANFFQKEAMRHDELAKIHKGHVDAALNELNEMKNLIREHAPELLEHFPIVEFSGAVPSEAEMTLRCREMQKIECHVRLLVGEPKSIVVLPKRDDTPTEADMMIGRLVLSEMKTCHPKVEAFRKAVRAKGHKASDTKLGLLLTELKKEHKK